MTIVERIEKAIDFLRNTENLNKTSELQSNAGILGQCMGILGGFPSMNTQYTTLLQQSIPLLLSLCCHNSAELRLVADEALNRVVVGGIPFHSSRIHLHFHNSITSDKHPRWLKAALSRIYLGKSWLRPGTSRGRIFAQSTLIRLKDIVERVKDPTLLPENGDSLIMECLESNLPRIMKALSSFSTKDEVFGLLLSLIYLVSSPIASIRRNTANCIADLCQYHQKKFIPHVINKALTALQDKSLSSDAILGWFGVLKTVFNLSPVNTLNSDILSTTKYMLIFQICLYYIDTTKTNHNILNAIMDCLNSLLVDVNNSFRLALLNPKGASYLSPVKEKQATKTHQRSLSSISISHSLISTASSMANLSEDILLSEHSDNFAFSNSNLANISQSQTPYRSIEDLSMKGMTTPDSFSESMLSELNSEVFGPEQLSLYVKKKLEEKKLNQETEETSSAQFDSGNETNSFQKGENFKINIGSMSDADIPLKYCARLLISRFLLSGYNDCTMSDQYIRVSVKASAFTCLISLIDIYPEAISLYLSMHCESFQHNLSGNSEVSANSNNEQLNDFILERNICYQESLTDSFAQELLSKSTDLFSQASGSGSSKSGVINKPLSTSQNKDRCMAFIEETIESNSLAGVSSEIFENKQISTVNDKMDGSCVSGDLAMTGSNFTMGSQTTASNYPASTDILSTSIDPLTSSMDLEMIFDHFGDSSMSTENSAKQTEIENKNPGKLKLEQMFQEVLTTEAKVKYVKQSSDENKNSQDKPDYLISGTSNINTDNKLEASNEFNDDKVNIVHKNDSCDNGIATTQISDKKTLESNGNNLVHQHMSQIFFLFENHPDPQVRGLVRICIGSFINSVCESTCGDYSKWKSWCSVPKEIINIMTIENLLEIILRGITDKIPQCVNHSITALKKCVNSFCNDYQGSILIILNYLRHIEDFPYWLCKVNLCHFYGSLDYQKLCIIVPDWTSRCWQILDIFLKFLNDQDQRVRKAAIETILKFVPDFHPPINFDRNYMITNLAHSYNEDLLFTKLKKDIRLLSDFKYSLVFSTLPNSMKELNSEQENKYFSENDLLYGNLKHVISILSYKLMTSKCKYFTQGCLELLLQLSLKYPPIKYRDAYCGLGLLDMALQLLEHRILSISCTETLLAFLSQMFSVEAWSSICHKNNSNKRASLISLPINVSKENQKLWCQFDSNTFSSKAEQFLKLVLQLLNIIIHVMQDVVPFHIPQKTSGIMPPSPMKKKTDDLQRKNVPVISTTEIPSDDKSRRKSQFNTTSGNFMPMGYFVNDVVFMKLYSHLRSAYSSHKVNPDATTSIFLSFMSTTLESLSVQLEVMSEKEAGKIAEEILYYLKYLLPFKPDSVVTCVTQLVKCLFSVNMTSQRNSMQVFLRESGICKKIEWADFKESSKISFYKNILTCSYDGLSFESVMNFNEKMFCHLSDTSENRINNKIAEGFGRNSHLQAERDCYLSIKNYTRSRTDKEWTTHKQEFARYLKLLEPVVVQAFKSYTIQNNVDMQCKVLELMNQLLALRINYCFLNSDKVFVEFVLKQLEFIERNEMSNCGELVRYIFTFLVHLSSAEHHTKQLMDIPKLIQLCDGLMASEVYNECVEALHPLAYKVFVLQQQVPGQSRIQLQEAQVTKEVLFAMLQKMMRNTKVIKLISSVLIFSEEHPESHFKWSQLICDTLFQMMKLKNIDINCSESYVHLDKLFDCIHREVLYDQSKIETVLRIMFDNPPNQLNADLETKERWLTMMLLFLRKILFNLAENEILLSLNYLKTSYISPASIFFNSHNEIDPLNVQTVNENCANLSPDVIFIRFLFRLLTYALLELENYSLKLNEVESKDKNKAQNLSYWCKLTTSLICQVKDMLYLKDGCRFPLLAKTAQIVLQNEQSGLNTGLYSPEENIPLKRLANICTKISWKRPMLTVHWCHLLIRLKFIEQKNWGSFLGFLQNSAYCNNDNQKNLNNDILQIGCFLTLCEHFVDNGLDDVINLTWLLVNKINLLIQYYDECIVQELVGKINDNSSASGLLLQAIAARCQLNMKGTYGIKVYTILSGCHPSQSGALLFCICRFIGRLPISNSIYFMKLAIKKCRYLALLPVEDVNSQLPLDDLQLAMEILHNDKVDKRYPELIEELNSLASSIYNLSPLDIPMDRPINPQNIKTSIVDTEWLLSQIKSRCYKSNNIGNYGKYRSTAKLLSVLSVDDLNSVFNSNDFDILVIQQALKLGTEKYIRELIDKTVDLECVKVERRYTLIEQQIVENEELINKESNNESSIFSLSSISRFKKSKGQSQFFIPIGGSPLHVTETKKLEPLKCDEKCDIELPDLNPLLTVSLKYFHKLLTSVILLFPKHVRPLSHVETGASKDYQTMDKYTRRCYMVFVDKFFYQLLPNIQSIISAYLKCLKLIQKHLQKIDADAVNKITDTFLPKNLSHSLMLISIISLQYSSYLIRQQENILSPDIKQGSSNKIEYKDVDHMIDLCIKNASECFSLKPVWQELNTEENILRIFSAINCLYNYLKFILKDTLPIRFDPIISSHETNEESKEIAITCDKLLTMVQYWQNNVDHFGEKETGISNIMKEHMEMLLVSLCRCKFASSFILIPPCAWEGLQLFEDISKIDGETSSDTKNKVERKLKSDFIIPIDILQDTDILEQFLFRVNLIGWTCKKSFEEIWVSFLGALQGNGTQWAVRGMMQLLLSTNNYYCGRNDTLADSRIKKIKDISFYCDFYDILFSDINLESVPYKNYSTYHCSQMSIEYLKYISGLTEFPDIKVQNISSQSKKSLQNSGIDINSCVHLLIDIAAQVWNQSDWGLGARVTLLSCIVNISDLFTSKLQWQWLSRQLSSLVISTDSTDILSQQFIVLGQAKTHCVLGNDIADINQLTASLSSSFAPVRIAALHAAIMHLSLSKNIFLMSMEPEIRVAQEQFNALLEIQLLSTIQPHLVPNAVVSLREQSLCWSGLFALINFGNVEILKTAVDVLFSNQNHFCFDLILQGICHIAIEKGTTLENEVKTIIFKAIDDQPEKCNHLLPVLLTQIYSGGVIETPESTLEPEQLLVHLQTFATLQKSVTISPLSDSKSLCRTLVFYLKDFLPPAAILNKVVQEFIDCCRWADSYYLDRNVALIKSNVGLHLAPFYVEMLGNVVFEVFEAAISQEQLLIFNGWLFDGINHFIDGKISHSLIPFCLLSFITSASSNNFIRSMAPVVNHALQTGCSVNHFMERICQTTDNLSENTVSVIPKKIKQKTSSNKMSYNDMKLLCLGAIHSNFTKFQLEKLKTICIGKTLLNDLRLTLDV